MNYNKKLRAAQNIPRIDLETQITKNLTKASLHQNN